MCFIASQLRRGENKCVHLCLVFPSQQTGAEADKLLSILQSHLTRKSTLIRLIHIKKKIQIVSGISVQWEIGVINLQLSTQNIMQNRHKKEWNANIIISSHNHEKSVINNNIVSCSHISVPLSDRSS